MNGTAVSNGVISLDATGVARINTTALTTTGSHTITATYAETPANLGSAGTATVTISTLTLSTFTATPGSIAQKQTTTLSWSLSGTTGGESLVLSAAGTDGSLRTQSIPSGQTSLQDTPTTNTTYTLTATNSFGSTLKQTSVTLDPAILVQPSAQYVHDQAPATFSVLATGTSYEWHAVVGLQDYVVQFNSTQASYTIPAATASTSNTPASDGAQYYVVVSGANGSVASDRATLHVIPGSGSLPGAFQSGGSLTFRHKYHTATLLPSGKVLVAGGTDGSNGNAATPYLELFDPATGTGTPGTLKTARLDHAATLLPDGKVLLTGGQDANGQALNTAEVYDPATGTTAYTNGPMTVARTGHSSTLLPDGTVLIAFGNSASTAELYNPVQGTFSQVLGTTTATLYPRLHPTATLLSDGRVLIAQGVQGGSAFQASQALMYDYRTNPMNFDGIANGFSSAGAMTAARNQAAATLLPGANAGKDVVLFTGGDGNGNTSAEWFDAGAGQFNSLTDPNIPSTAMGVPRVGHAATLLPDGRVLLTGGSDSTQAELFQFDPSNPSFTFTGQMGRVRTGATATLLPSGKVLALGGDFLANDLFDPQDPDPANPQQTLLQPATAPLSDLALMDTTLYPPSPANQYTTQFSATVSPTAGAQYAWMVGNGSLNSGQGQPTATMSATGAGPVTIDLLVTSRLGIPAHASGPAPGPAKPAIIPQAATLQPNQASSAAVAQPQAGVTYTWSITNGSITGSATGTSVSFVPGATDISGGFTGSMTLTCKATDAAGSITQSTLTLAIQRPPVITAFTVTNAIYPSTTAPVSWSLAGPVTTVAITVNGTEVHRESGPTTGGSYTATLGAFGTYTFQIKATNDGGTSTATMPITYAPELPGLDFFAVNPTITVGNSDMLVYTVAGVVDIWTITDAASNILASGTSQAPASSLTVFPSPTRINTYTLTATNFTGTVTRSVTINYPTPSISYFGLYPGAGSLVLSADDPVPYLGTTTLQANFVGGLGTVSPDIGPVSPGSVYNVGPLEFSTLYTLTVSNGNPAQDQHATSLITVADSGDFALAPAVANSTFPGRHGHTATLMPDGRLLLIGGQDSLGNFIQKAEWFNPATGQISLAANLLLPRAYHTATLLPDGSVLVAGGIGWPDYPNQTLGVTANLERFFPDSGVFNGAGSLPTTGIGHTATLLTDGRVLLAGGLAVSDITGSGNTFAATGTISNSTYFFDSSAGTVTPGVSLLTPRRDHSATLLSDGSVLLAGGQSPNGYLNSAELFIPATQGSPDSLIATGNLTQARTGHAATVLPDGTVLLVGGASGANAALATAERYFPGSQSFSPVSNAMVQGRYQPTATLLPDGKVLVAGGKDASGVPLQNAELYLQRTLPATGLQDGFRTTGVPLSGGNPMANPRWGHTATLLPSGLVLLVGGLNTDGSTVMGAEWFAPKDATLIPAPAPQGTPMLTYSGTTVTAANPQQTGVNYAWRVYGSSIGSWTPQQITFDRGATMVGMLSTSILGVPALNQAYVDTVHLGNLPSTALSNATLHPMATVIAPGTNHYFWEYSSTAASGWNTFGGDSPNADLTVVGNVGVVFTIRCTVTYADGNTWSDQAQVTIISPNPAPTVQVTPSNLSPQPGDIVTFTVQVTGTAPLAVQWRKSNSIGPLTSWTALTSPYTFVDQASAGTVTYTVTVTDAYGVTASYSVNITATSSGTGGGGSGIRG